MFLKIYKHSFLASLRTIFPLLIIQPILGIIGGVLSKLAVVFKKNLHLVSVFTSVSSIPVKSSSTSTVTPPTRSLYTGTPSMVTDR